MTNPHITVPDESPSADFAVVGSTSDFAITWTVFDQTDLRVTVNSVELLQSEFSFVGTAGYEGGYPGGTVTLNVAVTNSAVRIWSEMPPARVNDFLEGAGMPARALNTEFDRLTARARDVRLRNQRTPVLAFATNHTLTEAEAGQIFTNEGASATRTFTLPPASAGLLFTFAVVVAHSLVIDADGTDTVGGAATLTGAAIGDMIAIRGFDDGTWSVESSSGTWA
jgi:hypothetical protein